MAPTQSKSLGIALSGAAVRGFVHLGILQSLEEEGIKPNFLGGSSAGSLIAYLYSAGLTTAQILKLAKNISWFSMIRPIFSSLGFISFKPIEQLLTSHLGNLHFEDLATPLIVSASDLDTGKPVLFNSGPVAPAVHASCAIPGLVRPVKFGGYKQLVDGGVTNNTPSEAVRSIGAEYVVAVDVFAPHKRKFAGPIGVGINAVEIMVRNSNLGTDNVDCLIAPDLSDVSFNRFSQKQRMIDIGRKEAEKHIDTIKAGISRQKATA